MLNSISSLEFNGCLNIYFNHGVIIDQKSNFTMLPAVLKSCSILLNTKISILKTSLLKALSFPFNLVFYFIFSRSSAFLQKLIYFCLFLSYQLFAAFLLFSFSSFLLPHSQHVFVFIPSEKRLSLFEKKILILP